MYQKLIIIGHIGSSDLKYTGEGKPVLSFSVATSRRYKDSEETTWFRCTYWGEYAEEASRRLAKGMRVMVEGQLRPDPATGSPKVYEKRDGSWGASYEVAVDTYRTLSKSEEVNA